MTAAVHWFKLELHVYTAIKIESLYVILYTEGPNTR